MLISRKLVQRRGIGEKCVFFSLLSGRHQMAKVKKSTKSIFTTGLYFLPDSATHISFYYKQHFFRTFANLEIFRIYWSPSSVLNLVLRPHRVRRNRKESGLAQSRASFCGIHFATTRTSAFGRYFTITIFRMRCGHDSWNDTDGKTFQYVVI